MRRFKTVGAAAALVAAALVGGTLISATLAANQPSRGPAAAATTDADAPAEGKYLDAYLDTLASKLGVQRSALGPAALAAATAAIDAAVAGGDLTAERATALKERLSAMENPERLLVGHGAFRGFHDRGPKIGFGPALGNVGDAAAKALGIETSALAQAMRDGKSLKDLATEKKVDYKTVSDAVLAAVKAELATKVSAQDITQKRADEAIARVTEWLAGGGELRRGFGPGFGRGFGRGFGH